MIESILSNICILLLMHLCIQTLYFRIHDWPFLTETTVKWLQVAAVSLATVSMFYTPITAGEYRFDLRAIPIAFLALLHGPHYAVPALLFASAWRWLMGGDGAFPGIAFGLVLPCVLALLFNRLNIMPPFSYTRGFVAFTCFWLVSDLPIIVLVPSGAEVFKGIAPLRFLSFHFAAFLLYFFIHLSRNHLELMEKLKFYADHDPLTRLYNMRKFVEAVHSNQADGPHYIVMMDVDFFKNINDTYGHQNGDEVLKKLARIIQEFAPEHMTVGRYGGEEFIACLSAENDERAAALLHCLRAAIEQATFLTTDGKPMPRITVSIGFAPFDRRMGIENAIERADQYLYIAKRGGRNRIASEQGVLSS